MSKVDQKKLFEDDWLKNLLETDIFDGKGKDNLVSFDCQSFDAKSGFMSDIVKIHIIWKSGVDLPKSIILKLISSSKFNEHMAEAQAKMDPEQMAQLMADMMGSGAEMPQDTMVKDMHETEVGYLKMFAGEKPPIPVPHCYLVNTGDGGSQMGYIFMQDFSDVTSTVNCLDGFNLEQAKEVVSAIAKLHAYCLETNEWRHVKAPMQQDKNQTVGFVSFIKVICNSFRDMYPDQFTTTEEQVEELCNVDRWWDQFADTEKYQDVLVHGDLWTNNILTEFDKENQKFGVKVLALIDWQLTHPGTVGEDLCRVMVSSMDADMRREHELELIDYYYESLTKLLGIEPSYSVFDVVRSYYANMQFQSMFWMNQIPLMLGNDKEKHDPIKVNQAIKRFNFAVQDALKHNL